MTISKRPITWDGRWCVIETSVSIIVSRTPHRPLLLILTFEKLLKTLELQIIANLMILRATQIEKVGCLSFIPIKR